MDSRTSVKYVYSVQDARCIEGSCGHLVRFCVCVSGDIVTDMTTYRNDTKTGLETQSKLISYNLF